MMVVNMETDTLRPVAYNLLWDLNALFVSSATTKMAVENVIKGDIPMASRSGFRLLLDILNIRTYLRYFSCVVANVLVKT